MRGFRAGKLGFETLLLALEVVPDNLDRVTFAKPSQEGLMISIEDRLAIGGSLE